MGKASQFFANRVRFFKQCKMELQEKTTWPSKNHVMNSTIVVIVSIVVVSSVFFALDYGVSQLIGLATGEYLSVMRSLITPVSFVVFVVAVPVLVFIYSTIKKRISRY